MVRGAPDGIVKYADEGFLGQGVTALSIQGAVAGGVTASASLTIPSANTENIYIHIVEDPQIVLG